MLGLGKKKQYADFGQKIVSDPKNSLWACVCLYRDRWGDILSDTCSTEECNVCLNRRNVKASDCDKHCGH